MQEEKCYECVGFCSYLEGLRECGALGGGGLGTALAEAQGALTKNQQHTVLVVEGAQ